MKYLVLLVWIFLSSCAFAPSSIQPSANTCSAIVTSAMKATGQFCDGTQADQVCYGHVHLDAQPQPGFGPFQFSQAGDKVDVMGIQSLQVSAMDTTTGTWGVALMHVAANLPNTVDVQNVTLLFLGDVQVQNKVPAKPPVPVTVTALSNVNVRQQPELSSYVMETLHSGETVQAKGRLADNSWLYIQLPDSTNGGWIYGPSVGTPSGVQTLAVVDPDTAFFGPMQAFYVQTGDNDNPSCADAPENGLMIQTSEGAAEVDLWINEVKIRLGSTAFIQAQPNKNMTITMLEGASHVQAQGVEYTAPAGTELTVPMNSNLQPAAPPNPPVPIKNPDVKNLPVQELDRPITIPTLLPTAFPTVTAVPPTFTLTNTNTLIPSPTWTPTLEPTDTDIPTLEPTDTQLPSDTPSDVPTLAFPTDTPVPSDTPIPSDTPSDVPTMAPPPDTPIPSDTATEVALATEDTSGIQGGTLVPVATSEVFSTPLM